MTFLWELVASVLRVVFLRGSPERIYYTRRLFIGALLCAVTLSASAQWLYFGDHVVFVILRVFAEIMPFMLMMVLLTAKIARFRLARMMLVLVLISALADALLLLISPLTWFADPAVQAGIGYMVGAAAIYGCASVVAWGLNRPLSHGAGVIGLYVAAAVGLDLAFRHLYQIMAAG